MRDEPFVVTPDRAGQLASLLYRAMLKREPDEGGLALYSNRLAESGLEGVLEQFLGSDEFARIWRSSAPSFTTLNFAGPMPVDTMVSPDELDRLWQHVSTVWSMLGETDAFWSVITAERYRGGQALTGDRVAEFYSGGQTDVRYLQAYLRRAGLALQDFPRALEYGCGVGRVTQWLAPRVDHLRGVDISAPHLEAAKAHLADRQIGNVDLRLLRTKADLDLLRGFDLFFSMIVLQHNPPPIILDVLAHAFDGLNPNGIAFFQVPTYSEAYTFELAGYWRDVAQDKAMEMHFLPQRDILNLADACGMKVLEIRNDHCIGSFESTISTTFLLQKRG